MAAVILGIGPIYTLVAGTIYALPTRLVTVRAQPITNILVSNDGTTFAAPAADSGGQFITAGLFIKDTVGGALVRCAVS